MIATLTGTITHHFLGSLILEAGGVGYRVHATTDTLETLKKETGSITLFTYLAVRETSHELYGFLTDEELAFFELLVSISGIGPKSGLAILSVAPVETLRMAISHGDSSYLTKVSGIGKKNAEKIIIELSDKLGALESAGGTRPSDEADTFEALRALGYGAKEIRDALKAIPQEITDTKERLKEALKILGT